MSTVNRKAIEAITGKLSYRCTKLHNGKVVSDADNWPHRAYRVTMTFKDGGKYSTTYKMGTAHTTPPQVQAVLPSLLLDATPPDQSFEDWCADLGYSNDSIRAHNAYLDCVRCGQWLRASLTTKQINQLGELFQDF